MLAGSTRHEVDGITHRRLYPEIEGAAHFQARRAAHTFEPVTDIRLTSKIALHIHMDRHAVPTCFAKGFVLAVRDTRIAGNHEVMRAFADRAGHFL